MLSEHYVKISLKHRQPTDNRHSVDMINAVVIYLE